MKKRLLLFMLLLIGVLSAGVKAEVVGFNVSGNWDKPKLEGLTAEGCSQWTDALSNNGTGLELIGTDGLVTVDWSSNNLWDAGPETEVENKLYRMYLDDGGNGVHVTIHGIGDWMDSIGAAGCILRIYQNSDGNYGEFQEIQILNKYGLLETAVMDPNIIFNPIAPNPPTPGDEYNGERGFVDVQTMIFENTIDIDFHDRADGEPRSTMAAFKLSTVSEFYATQPSPKQLSEAPVTKVLTWQQAADANGQEVSYNVYFGDPNELSPDYYANHLVKTTTSNPEDFFYAPAVMDNSTEYAWRVDTVVPGDGVYTGFEWKFVTQPPLARVETDPVGMTVEAGTEEVQLTVDSINSTVYQWYKNGELLDDDATGTLYTGEDTMTLTIYDVQTDDEGLYYCVVDNSMETPDQSEAALLITERMVGWWKMDGDLTDSINDVVADVPFFNGSVIDPNFAEGIDGSAFECFGEEESVITISGSAQWYNFYPNGYTVSAWVKNTQAGVWASYVNKQQRADTPWKGYSLGQESSNAIHTLREADPGDGLSSGYDVTDDQWHLVTGTFDAVNGELIIYIDGVARNTRATVQEPDTNDFDVMFGAELPDATVSPYDGLLDDVRIWSYPLDPVSVAKLYVEFNPDSKVCVENPLMDISGPNGERDCVVDLFDVLEVAAQWLECNIVPDCLN